MTGVKKPLDPHETSVISQLSSLLPLQIIAELLNLTIPQVQLRIKKMAEGSGEVIRKRKKKGSGKGSGKRLSSFVWHYRTMRFPGLEEIDKRKLDALWEKYLRLESIKLAKNPPDSWELSPADVICLHRRKFPALVWRELFGLSDKTYRQIARAVGSILPQGDAARQIRDLNDESYFPDFGGMPDTQVEKIRLTVERLRKKRRETLQAKKKKHAAALLNAQKRKRNSLSSQGLALHPCTGGCNESWPRTEFFFSRVEDTTDGLLNHCKHCLYRRNAFDEKKKTGKCIPAESLTPERLARLEEIFPSIAGQVPTCYIQKALELTPKQFHRVVRRAKCTLKKGKGESRLLCWRLYEEVTELPNLSCLNDKERSSFIRVWSEDRAAWLKSFEESDAKLLRAMRSQQTQLDESRTPQPCKRLCKCCKQEWSPRKYFFPISAGRYQGYCRFCNIRTVRAMEHAKFKKEGPKKNRARKKRAPKKK